jgi:hypothetical protein
MASRVLFLALFLSFAPAAYAGGLFARIEGPGPDGTTYTARTYSCNPSVSLEPWALAEGRVNGKRRSVLIRVKPTAEHGVYEFQRSWPKEGRWMIRYMLGHPPAPATVATLRADGSVERNQLYFHSDGTQECSKALRVKGRKAADDDDC